MEELPLERKEAKALEEQLRRVAKEMMENGQGALSDSASAMADGIKGDGAKFKAAAKTLAKQVAQHAQRKKINSLLCSECNKLAECKANCNCNKNSTAKGQAPKSNSPSSNWGMGVAGNSAGEKTDLLAELKFEQLTGQEGDGDSEIETEHSIEGRQSAGRGYKEVYQKYRKLSDAVLDSEPIPLGHRQTIRRYFELIRPQQADEAKPATTEPAK